MNLPSLVLGFLALLCPLRTIAQTINVRNYGAQCNGVADDTVPIQAAIDAAVTTASNLLFPESSGPCVVSTITFHGTTKRWIVSTFDNALIATSINIAGNNLAFIGHGTPFFGLSGAFISAPMSTWEQTQNAVQTFIDISGSSQIYFDRISIQGQSAGYTFPIVHIHDANGAGSIWLRFYKCTIATGSPAILIDASSPSTTAGFGLYLDDCSVETSVPSTYAMDVTNFGEITVSHGYLGSIHYKNAGIASSGDIEIDNVLSENLQHDFMFVEASPGIAADITLRRVGIADFVNNSVYLFKAVTNNNQLTNVKIEMIPIGATGAGLIDPTSTPTHIGLICEGYGCERTTPEVLNTLYWGQLTGPRGPTVFYGSVYQPQPMQIQGSSQ